ncbi:hypothetical protein CFP56_023793 [Quercus suber]|uniref:Non-LTR retroelement reverse transcriptase n=1 Tax=Quercus suber TaxID=58331 RepID=A0AAW0K861_QUESU|nr:hypothetical protein CFP56_70085 [Quercus suber]
MLWKEGAEVQFKSCSNTHIDVFLCEGNGAKPWRATGFYGHSDAGWLDRDDRQMEGFRECLSNCGLFDLGFVGQRFTWCNGRIGEQRTLVRLDGMVANKEWLNMFPEAKVVHISMAASDHCLLSLSLRMRALRRVTQKRFMFEEMWTKEEGCREVVERAWDPLDCNPELLIHKRLKRCQAHLQN